MDARRLARGLGWFSIGLGLVEVLRGGKLSKKLGLQDREELVRGFGLREIANGVLILARARKSPWVWARVAGDVLDLALLATAKPKSERSARDAWIAAANVAAVAALDFACGRQLSKATA